MRKSHDNCVRLGNPVKTKTDRQTDIIINQNQIEVEIQR